MSRPFQDDGRRWLTITQAAYLYGCCINTMRTPRARAAARVETESAPAVPVAPERLWTEKATAFAKACHATLMQSNLARTGHCGHPHKDTAIARMRRQYRGCWQEYQHASTDAERLRVIRTWPYMGGKALPFQLAKNLGVTGFCKPDVHLNRLASLYGWKEPQGMTETAFAKYVDLTPAAIRAGNDRKGRWWDILIMCTIAGFRFDFAYQGPYAVSGIGEKIEQCLYELRGNKTLSNIDPYEATVEELCALRDRFAA